MGYILNIETATKNCSVCIANEGKVIALKEMNNGNYSHAEVLHTFIQDVFKEASCTFNEIDAIAVSSGPGSYTGLRIGVSAAKGLCFAFDVPLISVNTLEALSKQISTNSGFIVPMIDARRMEVYAAVYNHTHTQVRTIKAEVITQNAYSDFLAKETVYFLGDGAHKCKEIISHKNAVFVDDLYPSAKEMAALSFYKYQKSDIEDVAYFEPFYLKDFIVVPEKKKKPIL